MQSICRLRYRWPSSSVLLLLVLLLPSLPSCLLVVAHDDGGVAEELWSWPTHEASTIPDDKRELPAVAPVHPAPPPPGLDTGQKTNIGTLYYDVSTDKNYSTSSISWMCCLPLVFVVLIWIVGPLLCLIICDTEKNNQPDEIILKNSHCYYCAARYTNRNDKNLNNMVFYFQLPRKYDRCWNHSKVGAILFVTTTVFLMCVLRCDALNSGCVDLKTCKSCFADDNCSWFFNQQTCDKTNNISFDLNKLYFGKKTSHNCPIIKTIKTDIIKHVHCQFNISIEHNEKNVKVLFKKFLADSKISIRADISDKTYDTLFTCGYSIEGEKDDGKIVCTFKKNSTIKAGVYHVNVKINNTLINLEDDNDYFLPIYDSEPQQENKDCKPCVFKDNVCRYYVGCRLSNNPNTIIYDRQPIDLKLNISQFMNISAEIKNCANLSISINSQVGPSTGNTNINITVRDIEKHLYNGNATVKVGDYDCIIQKSDDETITCKTSPITNRYNESYKSQVTVYYNGYLKLTSNEIYEYAKSEVTSITPNCGSVNGMTRLKISGKYLNVSGNAVKVTIGDNHLPCNIIESITENLINCNTSPSNSSNTYNLPEKIYVKFNDTTNITDDKSSFDFTYYVKPLIIPSHQVLESIVSGNTSITITGSNFSWINEIDFTVFDNKENSHNVDCTRKNYKTIVCKSPKLDTVPTKESGINFSFSIRVKLCEAYEKLDNNFSTLTMYSNPVFNSIEIENDDIVINGQHLNRGYTIEDVNLRQNNTPIWCNRISQTPNSIRCNFNLSSPLVLKEIHEIIVKIGDIEKKISVTKKVDEASKNISVTKKAILILILLICFILLCIEIYFRISKYLKRKTSDSSVLYNTLLEEPDMTASIY